MNYTITMCLKLKEEVEIPPTLINLIDDDFRVVLELSLLVVGVLEPFLSFVKKHDAKKTYNMFSLMLNHKFKTLQLILSYINYEGVAIVEEYNKRSLYLSLIK
jgi:hypothetical protein